MFPFAKVLRERKVSAEIEGERGWGRSRFRSRSRSQRGIGASFSDRVGHSRNRVNQFLLTQLSFSKSREKILISSSHGP
jgi:hypothetical protein